MRDEEAHVRGLGSWLDHKIKPVAQAQLLRADNACQ